MTQVIDIITAGLRESNVVAPDQNLTPTETAEALARLQALVLSSVGSEVGYIMEDWNVASATSYTRPNGVPIPTAQTAGFTIKPNSRLIFNLSAVMTITLDPQPQDGQRFSVVDAANTFDTYNLTINPNGRKIEGTVGNITLSTENTSKQWLYRSDIANWVVLDPLTEATEMPFPSDFDDYFIIALAMRLNPRYGRTIDDQSKARFDQQQLQFVNRYTQSRLRSVPSPAASNPARTPEG